MPNHYPFNDVKVNLTKKKTILTHLNKIQGYKHVKYVFCPLTKIGISPSSKL